MKDKDQVKLLHNQYMGNGQDHYFTIDQGQLQVQPDQLFWIQTHQEKITRLLGLLSSDCFVDLGCGEGYFTIPLSRRSKISVGFDFLTSAMEIVKRQVDYDPDHLSLVITTGENIPLEDQCVDKLLCNHVLEHVIDDDIFMGEIHRILRPGGRVLIGLPLEFSPQVQLLIRLRRFIVPSSYQLLLERAKPGELMPELIGIQNHIRFYSLKSVFNLLQRNGFQIVSAEGIGLSVPNQVRTTMRRSRLLFSISTFLSSRIPSIGDGVLVLAEKG
jgi:ubiquinone/menaquinone biosynthesis C-methylase UbiE